MEKFLTEIPEATTLRGLQALLPVLRENWGDAEGFRRAALPVFIEETGLARSHAAEVAGFLDRAIRQVARLRASQFSALNDKGKLEFLYQRLVPTAADSPVRQGFLWLAFQAQNSTIEFFDSEAGKKALADILTALEEQKALLQGLAAEDSKITFPGLEKILTTVARKVIGDSGGKLLPAAAAGRLIEWTRVESRKPPQQDLLSTDLTSQAEQTLKLGLLVDPVRVADLNEAHQRFLRLSNQERTQRFTLLRRHLAKTIPKVAPYSPLGFEKFCQAVEAHLFPYPAQLEWLRSYLKPIYTNAAQSAVFDNCMTEASIKQRYEKLLEEKTANPVMLELARAMAAASLTRSDGAADRKFLDELDLEQEFGWPTSFDQVKGVR